MQSKLNHARLYSLTFSVKDESKFDYIRLSQSIIENYLFLDENYNKIRYSWKSSGSSTTFNMIIPSNESHNIYFIDKSDLEENGLTNLDTPEKFETNKIYTNSIGLSEYTITGVIPTGETVVESHGGNSSLRVVVKTDKTFLEDEDCYTYCPKAYLLEKTTEKTILGKPSKLCTLGYYLLILKQ